AVNGVKIRLGAGTLNNGDTFTVRPVADSDSAGLLPALGLNTLFTGSGAEDLQIRPDLIANPDKLAVGLSELVGDGGNALRWAGLADATRFGTQSYTQHYAALAADVG